QRDRAHAQVAQDARREIIRSQIRREAELQVGLDRVAAGFLQRVRANLVAEADAAAFLAEVYDDAFVGLRNGIERALELLAAIALERAQHFAGPALAVNPAQDALLAEHFAANDGHVLRVVLTVPVHNHAESAIAGGDLGFGVPRQSHGVDLPRM